MSSMFILILNILLSRYLVSLANLKIPSETINFRSVNKVLEIYSSDFSFVLHGDNKSLLEARAILNFLETNRIITVSILNYDELALATLRRPYA